MILDPPSFAKSREGREGALRGYRDINRMGLSVLSPGGVLATSSCTQLIDGTQWVEALRDAAADAGADLDEDRVGRTAARSPGAFVRSGDRLPEILRLQDADSHESSFRGKSIFSSTDMLLSGLRGASSLLVGGSACPSAGSPSLATLTGRPCPVRWHLPWLPPSWLRQGQMPAREGIPRKGRRCGGNSVRPPPPCPPLFLLGGYPASAELVPLRPAQRVSFYVE